MACPAPRTFPPAVVATGKSPDRDVFVGHHSKVWHALSRRMAPVGLTPVAIGHRDISTFPFTGSDRVWVLSYSRIPAENSKLLQQLRQTGARQIVYVTSSSTIIDAITSCYEYPRVKRRAELEALEVPAAKVLTIGMLYDDPAKLPGGANVATSYDELAAFVAKPQWPDGGGRRKHLMHIVQRPFGRPVEHWAYVHYGRLQRLAGARPCILRPLDLLLRALGVRWYGYVYLSNSLWNSTIS